MQWKKSQPKKKKKKKENTLPLKNNKGNFLKWPFNLLGLFLVPEIFGPI